MAEFVATLIKVIISATISLAEWVRTDNGFTALPAGDSISVLYHPMHGLIWCL